MHSYTPVVCQLVSELLLLKITCLTNQICEFMRQHFVGHLYSCGPGRFVLLYKPHVCTMCSLNAYVRRKTLEYEHFL